jgi:hypothetical protein
MGVLDWVDRSGCADAACITVALEASPHQLLEAMGADLSSAKQATFEEAEAAWSEDATPIQVWAAEGRTIAVEPNGYLASFPENLRQVARRARDGELLREFDPLLYDDHGAPFEGHRRSF